MTIIVETIGVIVERIGTIVETIRAVVERMTSIVEKIRVVVEGMMSAAAAAKAKAAAWELLCLRGSGPCDAGSRWGGASVARPYPKRKVADARRSLTVAVLTPARGGDARLRHICHKLEPHVSPAPNATNITFIPGFTRPAITSSCRHRGTLAATVLP